MEEEKSELLTIAFADNTLSEPAPCMAYVMSELTKVGHTVKVYSYHKSDKQKMADLSVFIKKELKLPLKVEDAKAVDAEVFYDARNFGGVPGFYALFQACLQGGVIAPTEQNIKKFEDVEFWETGKPGSGIIMAPTPKIILPGE